MYSVNILTDQISIKPSELDENIDNIILNKIKNNFGNKCIKLGYVDKESIKVINRSLGKLLSKSIV